MPVSSISFDGEEMKISFLSGKVVVLAERSLVGLPAVPAFLMHSSTSSMMTMGSALLDNPDVEFAPVKLRNAPGYRFFLTVDRSGFLPPTSSTLSLSLGIILIMGSKRSLEKLSAKSIVGKVTSIDRG